MIYTGYFYIAVNSECIKLTYAYTRSISKSINKYLNSAQVSNYYQPFHKIFKSTHFNKSKLKKNLIVMKQKFDDFIIQKKGNSIRLDSKDTFTLKLLDDIDDFIEEFSNEYEYPYKIMDYSDYYGSDEEYNEDSSSEQDDPNNEPEQDDSDDEQSDEDSSSNQDDPNNEQSGEDYDDDSSSDDNDSSSDYDDFSGEFYDSPYKYSNYQKPVTRSDTRNELLKKNNTSNNIFENQPRRSPRLNKNLNTSSSNDNFIKKNSTQSKNIMNIKVIVKNLKINNTDSGDESCDKLINKLSSQLKMLNI